MNQPLYTKAKVKPIPMTMERKKRKFSLCTEAEVTQLRGLLGALAWLSKETRPDLAGRVALLQQCMPHPHVQDMLEANAVAREALLHADLGIRVYPIPPEHLRVGTVTDASWGNVRGPYQDQPEEQDYWVEEPTSWVRIHRTPRRILFHPGGDPGGPDLYEIGDERWTMTEEGNRLEDNWNNRDSQRPFGVNLWTGKTVFPKQKLPAKEKKQICEKFIQNQNLGSQGGYITFFYDGRMETEEQPFAISIVTWKSYKVRRCTVNTLSAECQAMIQGIGSLHLLRALLTETRGVKLELSTWEQEIGRTPFIAITDNKSLYDTVNKCRNTASHVEDKRTTIDITVLKNDCRKTQGQVRWIEGSRMISDSLTKRMNPSYLRKILYGEMWSLSEKGFSMQDASILLLISADREGAM
jgi:hypothetical protein